MNRVRYYRDELQEDFAATSGKIDRDCVDGSYRYDRRSPLWQVGVFLLYRLFATPVVWLYTRIWLGIRVVNRRAMKGIGGCFLYLNHTQDIADAFIPTIAAFPKHAHVITGPEAVSIRGIRTLVAMLGAVPLPSRFSAARNFENRLQQLIDEGRAVTVFPEAHIWPYCNFVRHFSDKSFSYPYRTEAPIIAAVVVYRQQRLLPRCHPHITVYLSDPLYPDLSLPEKQARELLRDQAFDFMSCTAAAHHSYAYIRYEKLEPEQLEPEQLEPERE